MQHGDEEETCVAYQAEYPLQEKGTSVIVGFDSGQQCVRGTARYFGAIPLRNWPSFGSHGASMTFV